MSDPSNPNQLDIFASPSEPAPGQTGLPAVLKEAGARFWPNFVTEMEENNLLTWLNSQPWLTELRRRVQHYGWRYDYKARQVKPESYIGPLPRLLADLARSISKKIGRPGTFDQAIINEYLPGQGISAHIDCQPCFGDTIAILSLESSVNMVFEKPPAREEARLTNRGLLAISGESRYQWTHSIPARKSDSVAGEKVARQRRVSITFREVNQ